MPPLLRPPVSEPVLAWVLAAANFALCARFARGVSNELCELLGIEVFRIRKHKG